MGHGANSAIFLMTRTFKSRACNFFDDSAIFVMSRTFLYILKIAGSRYP